MAKNIQRPREEERHIDPGRSRKHEPDEQRADGRAVLSGQPQQKPGM